MGLMTVLGPAFGGRSRPGGFLREQRMAGQKPQEIGPQVPNLHPRTPQDFGVAGGVQEIEDGHAAPGFSTRTSSDSA
jgi:hypothetical protein